MAQLGVITDGISRDFEHALEVLTEAGLDHAELQYLWDKEVGELTDGEMIRAQRLVATAGVQISCISRHNFAGILVGFDHDDPRAVNSESLDHSRHHLLALFAIGSVEHDHCFFTPRQ